MGKYIEIINESDEGNATYVIGRSLQSLMMRVAVVAVSDIQATGQPNGLGQI